MCPTTTSAVVSYAHAKILQPAVVNSIAEKRLCEPVHEPVLTSITVILSGVQVSTQVSVSVHSAVHFGFFYHLV